MASETQLPGSSSAFERMLRHRDLSLFLPFFLGFAGTATQSDPGQETPQTATPHERIILINPFTQGMVVIEGSESLDSLLRELATKNGQPPASKASIGAMPTVEIAEIGDKEGECAICLEEWELGGLAKEMPCKHRFHANCIEKWLGIHGSCPVCRYKMPVDEVDLGKKREEEEEGRERRRLEREIWVSFSFNSNRRSEDSNQPSSNSNDVFSSSPGLDQETEG
ncbi:hypothetical protein P3X46_002931 [Hevea brasiliensis]|uniref:RING-type E3 ubiquitin transferase n=1 Tax=Hevea brasiliensis TaxID=3981 RepID=A0ABQ9N787_HEVBR|nr:E3 ubiquitin-protein ligase MPSR1-like [Hevea brasiliensis]KAJ9187476.1 hypothetical protein P3X46_002931 [Hevea brasiliensis]